MRRDTKFAVIIVLLSFAVSCVLQGMRSSEKVQKMPHLIAQKSISNMLEEKPTNGFGNQTLIYMEEDILPEKLFVEEQRIIEEFTNEKQIESLLFSNKFEDSISWTNDMNTHDDTPRLPIWEETREVTFPIEENQIKTVSSNSTITHKIQAKDNLYNLAKKYYKDQTQWTKIYEANKNKMPDPHSLKIGQELLIPDILVSTKTNQDIVCKTLF